MEEWLKDSLGTIAVLVYLLYPLLKRFVERRKEQARRREQAETSKPAAERTGPRPETRRQRQASTAPRPDSEGAPQQRGPQRTGPQQRGPQQRGPQQRGPQRTGPQQRGPQQRGPQRRGPQQRGPQRRGPQRREAQETQAVARFEAELARARGEAVALIELIGADPKANRRDHLRVVQLSEPLRQELLPSLERIAQGLRTEPSMATVLAQTETFRELEAVLANMRGLIEQRLSSAASVLSDVDAIADASYAPFIAFARTQPVHLAERTPVAVRGSFDRKSLASTSIAPISVPSGFGRQVWGWPGIVHDVARDLFFNIEHLALDLHGRLDLPRRFPAPSTELELQVSSVRMLFGPWLPEVFADLVATLMLGPSYVESLLHTLASPRAPQRGSAILAKRGLIAEQPPARLRLYMACVALAELGYEAEGDALWSRWEAMHPNAQLFFLPLGGNWVGLSEHALTNPADELVALMLSEPWPELAGFRLASIPGLPYGKREEAEVTKLSERLTEGVRVDADARWLVAAAVMAAAQTPERQAQVLAAARQSLSREAVAKPRPVVSSKAVRPSSIKAELRRSLRDPEAVRQAVVLGASLCPRPNRQRTGS